jgi:very-short-patch-repair endonuclease
MSGSSFSSRSRLSLLAERWAEMRLAPTGTEARRFEALRAGKLGVSFRRQVPVLGRFIADFFAPAPRLVVEVDGAFALRRRTCCKHGSTRQGRRAHVLAPRSGLPDNKASGPMSA